MSDLALSVSAISKSYRKYKKPLDRLKHALWPKNHNIYEEFWALKDISFEVRKGETVGIVGRNGSGKSTLLQIICGTLSPSFGSVHCYGRVSALLELGSGFNHEFTGRENVYLSASIAGMTRAEIDAKFEQIEVFAEIGKFINEPVKHYSSGMFARLAFAVAINVDPQILVIDEILAVGDAAFQRKCINKFYEIRDTGCAILFVSHSDYQVKSVCRRALYLEQGRQKMFCEAARVVDQYNIDTQETVSKTNAQGTKSIAKSSKSAETNSAEFPESSGAQQLASAENYSAEEDNADDLVHLFEIDDVSLVDEKGKQQNKFNTGDMLRLTFTYRALTKELPATISFVFNLYRHDGMYICGTTTVMDGMRPFPTSRSGRVTIEFPRLDLLSGKYRWRVAINDAGGWVTLAEQNGVCEFFIEDKFKAIGMFNLERQWSIKSSEY
jgi:ABC-type polysaccharide/polyol phosphate transport system ATPase subunit